MDAAEVGFAGAAGEGEESDAFGIVGDEARDQAVKASIRHSSSHLREAGDNLVQAAQPRLFRADPLWSKVPFVPLSHSQARYCSNRGCSAPKWLAADRRASPLSSQRCPVPTEARTSGIRSHDTILQVLRALPKRRALLTVSIIACQANIQLPDWTEKRSNNRRASARLTPREVATNRQL
jgi:hypothetical protein